MCFPHKKRTEFDKENEVLFKYERTFNVKPTESNFVSKIGAYFQHLTLGWKNVL